MSDIYTFRIKYISGQSKYEVWLYTDDFKLADCRYELSFIERCKALAYRANKENLQLFLELGD